jgi:hypothetical protein
MISFFKKIFPTGGKIKIKDANKGPHQLARFKKKNAS